MSIAEMKLKVIEKVAASNDQQFVEDLLKHVEQSGAKANGQEFDVDEFYGRMVQEHGEVLRRLAQ